MEANNSNMTRLGPLDILAKKDCKVHSLSVSDQHATLLISHPVNIIDPTGGDNNNGKDEKKSDQNNGATATITKTISSILKLTIVPFHKQLLGSNPIISPEDVQNGQLPERNNLLRHNAKASEDIISFLSFYNFDPKSDSGAEYSYYEASPNSDLCTLVNTVKLDDDDHEQQQPNYYPQNKDRPNNNNNNNNDSLSLSTWSTGATEGTSSSSGDPAAMSNFGSFDIELISPASPYQIARAMPSLGHVLIRETPELYDAVVKPYIRSIVVDGGSLSWIQNLIEVKKEKERLLANCEKFIINIDTKWRSHPPPLSTPREEWYDHPSAVDLYCLGIVKGCGITCLRDLRGEHVSLLKDIMAEGLNAIRTVYGVSGDQIRIFIHYQPQFYHFHVHFTRLENETGCSVERGHLVSDVIQNLEMDSEYYCKRVITYKLKKGGALQNLIENYVDEGKVNAI